MSPIHVPAPSTDFVTTFAFFLRVQLPLGERREGDKRGVRREGDKGGR